MLRTLAGFNDANPSLRTWGRVIYDEATAGPPGRPALVMQNSKLLVSNVLENLVCNLPDRGELTRQMQIERIAPLLATARCEHLLDRLNQKVVECSLSEQRIIAILRYVVSGAPLIMIDEPTTGLRPGEAAAVLELIRQLARTHGVLLVLHNLLEAREVANEIILLASGRIQETARAEAFFAQPQSECGQLFLSTGSCPEISRNANSDEAEAPERPSELVAGTIVRPAPCATSQPSQGAKAVSPFVSQSAGPRGFLWVIPGKLAGTPWPGIVQDANFDLRALQAVGVTHLIALTEYPFDAVLAGHYGIRCSHSPMPDMHPPSEAQAWELCALIDALIARGEVVAVHCRAGLGRTGTVLTAYWLWLARGKLSALKALESMRRIEPMWVQSPSQVDFLEQFAAAVAAAAAESGNTPSSNRETRQQQL